MMPRDWEKALADLLSTRLSMPVSAFCDDPDAVRKVGRDGLCLVVYNGSENSSRVGGSAVLLTRQMQATVLLIGADPAALHEQIDLVYQAVLGTSLLGCDPMTVDGDELTLADSGLYQAVVMVQAKTNRTGA